MHCGILDGGNIEALIYISSACTYSHQYTRLILPLYACTQEFTLYASVHWCYLYTKCNIPNWRFRFCALSTGDNLHSQPINQLWKRDTGRCNLASELMFMDVSRFAALARLAIDKNERYWLAVWFERSRIGRWMCIWINFLLDNRLMKRLNRRSRVQSYQDCFRWIRVKDSSRSNGLERTFNVDRDTVIL